MISIGCDGIGKSYGTVEILKDVTFSLNEGDKLGIVGANGAGKSTLINIIGGKISDYDGQFYIAKDINLGILCQHNDFEGDSTVFEEILKAFEDMTVIEKKLEEVQHRMTCGDVSAADEYEKLTEKYKARGGLEYRSRAKSTLNSLGISEEMFNVTASSLSGGQKTVLGLAKILCGNYNMLILDEPTNHLDVRALEWLEKYIASFTGTVMIISHDRYFLDKTTNKTLEILRGKGKLYNAGYTGFIKEKTKNNEVQQHHYETQQKEIARLRAYIEQQRRWNRERNIIAAESREKAIDRITLVDAVEKEPDNIKLRFPKCPECANEVLEVCGLAKSYGEKKLFSDVSFLIKNGDRAFLLGDNGTGKSTMMKILTGHIRADKGELFFGNRVEVAYYDQEYQGLTAENTVLDELYYSAESDISTTKIRMILGSFLFEGDDVFKKVSDLSGGEKARLTFAKLILKPSNLLILDEPTNHLDIGTREVLEEALQNYGGTILAVSHDRYFIKKLATRILFLEQNSVCDYLMDYERFVTFRGNHAKETSHEKAELTSYNKEKYMADKKSRSEMQKKVNRYNKLAQLIDDTEKEISEVNEMMSNQENASDYKKVSELSVKCSELEKTLEIYYGEWEELYTQIGEGGK